MARPLRIQYPGAIYLRTVCDYVHLNPVRAKLLEAGVPLESYRWSSYGDYVKPADQRPRWLRVDRLLRREGHSERQRSRTATVCQADGTAQSRGIGSGLQTMAQRLGFGIRTISAG